VKIDALIKRERGVGASALLLTPIHPSAWLEPLHPDPTPHMPRLLRGTQGAALPQLAWATRRRQNR
jgi:hypothetical protein